MDALIILIMLGGLIRTIMTANKPKQQKEKRQSVPNQRRQPDRTMQRTTQEQRDAYYYQQQRNTKERLQKKYGVQQPVERKDILSKARENVQEDKPSMIQQEAHAQVCREYRDMGHKIPDVKVHKMQSVNCDTGEESDIIKKVNDLIVTGYSGEMDFDRDFIAEGIEMLNHFSL